MDLKVDEFVASQQGKPLVRLPRAPKDFVSALPRQFLDALPSRRERLKNRVIEPKKERDVTYDDVAPWLRSSSKIRQGQGFVKRYTPRISDPAFPQGARSAPCGASRMAPGAVPGVVQEKRQGSALRGSPASLTR
jgi:hypothetical protein